MFLNRSGIKVLEYGFGSGVNTIHLLRCGYHVTELMFQKMQDQN